MQTWECHPYVICVFTNHADRSCGTLAIWSLKMRAAARARCRQLARTNELNTGLVEKEEDTLEDDRGGQEGHLREGGVSRVGRRASREGRREGSRGGASRERETEGSKRRFYRSWKNLLADGGGGKVEAIYT